MAAAERTISFVFPDLPGCPCAGRSARLVVLLATTRATAVVCDVADARPDAATVDALARLELVARRYGARLLLRRASPELLELVALMGLSEALELELRVEPRG
jgi:hypothetical protein